MSVPVIELDAVEHVYANGLQALQPVSLQVRAGEFLTLLGPSGCGKSTLLRIMAGLMQPSAGQARLQGRSPTSSTVRARLSFVFQEATLMPWATVADNVRLPLDLDGVPRAQADARAREALAQVGLAGFEAHRPHELSGGMQMRVSLARGLVIQPTVLLMDEPFAALDEITRHKLDDDLRTLWQQQGLTVIFVTHSLTEAAYLSSRVAVMAARPGRIVHEQHLPDSGPRDVHHRTSAGFNDVVRQLQDQLAQAGAMGSRALEAAR